MRSGGIFDIAAKERRVAEIDVIAGAADFWNSQDRAQVILKERTQLTQIVERFRAQEKAIADAIELNELAKADGDESMGPEIAAALATSATAIEQIELDRMLSGEFDRSNAIVSINAGAGGTESQDWAQMLTRMISRWCERRGFRIEVVDELPGEEAGLKSVTFTAAGDFAYGYLQSEIGVHRLVRISPFDANARRHTSFASVAVLPELDDTIDVTIEEKDLRIDTYRAGGAGGQHVNKTDSAVRLTHLPTGIVVQCQNERSQHKNKSVAMKILKARLYERERALKDAKMDQIQGEKTEIAWGHQIRSYVLQPYRLIKDHRTEVEVGDVDRVLDGDLDGFMRAFLLQRK